LSEFLGELPRKLTELERCIEARERTELSRCAHTLKGAAATVGGDILRAIAERLEEAGVDETWESLGREVRLIQAASNSLQAAILLLYPDAAPQAPTKASAHPGTANVFTTCVDDDDR